MNCMKKVFSARPAQCLILFDFDGTIVDTLQQVVKIINRLGSRFGYTVVDEKNLDDFRENGGDSFFDKTGIKKLVLPLILPEVIKAQSQDIVRMKLFPGLKEVLQNLKSKGYRLGIVSSNGEENVRKYLTSQKMNHLFECVHSGGGLFGKDRVIEKVIEELGYKKENVVYVGDEVRDIQAARDAEVKIISVCWGYHSKLALRKSKPDFIVGRPSELLGLFGNYTWWQRLFGIFNPR